MTHTVMEKGFGSDTNLFFEFTASVFLSHVYFRSLPSVCTPTLRVCQISTPWALSHFITFVLWHGTQWCRKMNRSQKFMHKSLTRLVQSFLMKSPSGCLWNLENQLFTEGEHCQDFCIRSTVKHLKPSMFEIASKIKTLPLIKNGNKIPSPPVWFVSVQRIELLQG